MATKKKAKKPARRGGKAAKPVKRKSAKKKVSPKKAAPKRKAVKAKPKRKQAPKRKAAPKKARVVKKKAAKKAVKKVAKKIIKKVVKKAVKKKPAPQPKALKKPAPERKAVKPKQAPVPFVVERIEEVYSTPEETVVVETIVLSDAEMPAAGDKGGGEDASAEKGNVENNGTMM